MLKADSFVDKMKQKPQAGNSLFSDYTNGLQAFRDQGTPSDPVFKAPEKFSYDANSDPSYQAALRQAQEGAKTATNNAMVSLGSRGIGNSSVAVDRGNQIQQKAIGNVNDTILPQLMSQAYGRYQDQNNNDYRNAIANYNVGQDNIRNGQWDKTFDAGRQDAATAATGIYNPSGISTDQANQEMLKDSAAYGTATPEVQKQLHDRNMVLAQLLGKTYDPNTGTYSEGQGFAGTKTMQAKQLDSNLNEVAYGHARDSLLDKRYEDKFNQDIQQQGFDNALKIAVQQHQISNDNAQISISQQNANTSSSNSSWARDPKNPDNQYKLAELDKLKNGSSADMTKELDGLYTGITSGQLTASAAISEIDGKVKAGLTTAAEAATMKKLIGSITSSQPNVMPKLTQQQIEQGGGTNPQDLNMDQLYKLWKTDSTGEAAGAPSMDWAQWYRDPRGRIGGTSYNSWHQAYGPQLKAK
jgi:hypothetical protein